MSAGTITLTNGSAVVGGSGTSFATELAAGDFIVSTVGGITYTLPVKTVDSDIELTLVSKFPGPTQSASAWNAVPRSTQNLVTAALVAQTTEALRGQNYDKANWQAVFSASGDITVMLPDGSTFTGPSWNKIAELLNDIDLVELQTLATQVHDDALQVQEDREDVDAKVAQVTLDAQSASTDAQTAATERAAAENANASAQQAKIDATAAAADAAAAAQSVDPDNLLKKAENLADLLDKSASRGNLSVYSIAEINSKLGYALVDFGTVGVNARYVQANPFGNSTPVICQVEIYFNGKWGAPGWVSWYENSIMNAYGLRGGMVLGEGLVVQTARSYLESTSNNLGSLLGTTTGGITSVPCRMHVWKLVP
ncbi:TPA: hypothetical protein ACIRVD_001563 [Enterobacter roggenkampii]